MGPAGAGKSTFCEIMEKHCVSLKRPIHIVNLDPAAENFSYTVSIDIKNLITIDDVMEEMNYGPNGALVYCMEYLVSNMDWLKEELGHYEDDYLIFDLPGQIELYSHIPVMNKVVNLLKDLGFNLCCVYLLDAHFMSDNNKFLSGALQALSAMIHLETPHVNVITKMDLLPPGSDESEFFEKYFEADVPLILAEMYKPKESKWDRLTTLLAQVIQEYNMVNFYPLNPSDEESVNMVLMNIDHAMQYGEDEEPKEPKDENDFLNENQNENND
uniref:GPN-loop GTPase 3 n=1 Tax=Arcella intermedia TaxID=1963864 RepID=A0A6B2LD66_9EUKA